MRLALFALAWLELTASAAVAGRLPWTPKLLPVDEASRDPSFVAFRDRLRQAVVERDADFVLGVLSPTIQSSFGGDGGIEEFRETWHPEQPSSGLFRELGTVLDLGGTWSDGSFWAPYVFGGELHGVEGDHAVVIGTGVRLRSAPSLDAAEIAWLDYDVVQVLDWKPIPLPETSLAWLPVKLADGREGYVAERYVRSVTDYRAAFAKEDGQWLMTYFLAAIETSRWHRHAPSDRRERCPDAATAVESRS